VPPLPLPLFVAGAPNAYPLLAQQDDRLIVCVANLSAGALRGLTIHLRQPAFPIRHIHVLRADGGVLRLG